MTSRATAQCLTCRHWTSPLDRAETAGEDHPTQTCSAFPKGIPDAIWWNRADHRQPYDGDHGVRWESDGGRHFPEWAMSRGA